MIQFDTESINKFNSKSFFIHLYVDKIYYNKKDNYNFFIFFYDKENNPKFILIFSSIV